MASEVPSNCVVCKKDSSFKCSRCKSVRYCSKEHQKEDWKSHKRTCFPPGSICTRCNEPTASSPECRVPHPPHLFCRKKSTYRLEGAKHYGLEEAKHSYVCYACESGITLSGAEAIMKMSDMTVSDGPQWCFEGVHTISPVEDDRRVFKGVVKLTPGSLQEEIDSLDGDKVRVLKICTDCFFDSESLPTLNRKLPALEELQIDDVDMREITLNAELTPKLKFVFLQNVSDVVDCKFNIILPNLEVFHISDYGPADYRWLLRMLENAPDLFDFSSYKLSVGYLRFYSNSLRSIRLHSAELLTRIELWAPVLESLDVQATHDLEEIHFLKDHALKARLPPHFVCNDELHVNAANATLGNQALGELNAHPRVLKTIRNDS